MSTALAALVTAALSATVAAGPSELSPLLEPPPPWELGASLGGGWDTNPLAETSPSGSAFASGRAWIGRRFDLSESDELRLQLHYDGRRYHAASDADLDRPELGLEWDHAFGERTLLRLAGRGALRYQGDAARDGSDASLRAALRVAMGERWGLRLGVGGFYRDARDYASYGGGSGRVDAGLDVALWRRASLVSGYAFEMGTDFVTADSGGMGGARAQGRGLGATMQLHVLSADVLQALPGGFFVQGGYGYALMRGAGFSAESHIVSAELGWRR